MFRDYIGWFIVGRGETVEGDGVVPLDVGDKDATDESIRREERTQATLMCQDAVIGNAGSGIDAKLNHDVTIIEKVFAELRIIFTICGSEGREIEENN